MSRDCRCGIADEAPVLDKQWLVESEFGVGGLQCFGRRPAMHHKLHRIAWHQMNGKKRNQADADHHRDHLHDARGDIT